MAKAKKPTKKKAAPPKKAPAKKKASAKKAAPKKAAPKKAPKKATPEKPAKKSAKRAAKQEPKPFELENLRRPLEHLAHTTALQKDQLRLFIMGVPLENAVFIPTWHPVELVDVVVGGVIGYHLYLHPAGGLLFKAGTLEIVASATKMGPKTPHVWVEPPKDAVLHGVLAAALALVRGRPTYIDQPTGTPPPLPATPPMPVAAAQPATSAAQAYATAVAATQVAQDSDRAVADAAAAVPAGTGLRLANYRLPLERIDRTTPEERTQIEALMKQEQMGPLEEAHENEEIHPFELVDVVDVASGEVRYQVYLWPYGSGAIFEAASTKNIANICQHYWDQNPLDEELRSKFAAAWNEAKALGIHQAVIWK